MLVPGSNDSRCDHARRSVSCTRSFARSTSPHSDTANSLRLGTAASMAPRTSSGAVMNAVLLLLWLVKAAKQVVKLIRYPLVDHISVHGAQLQPDPALDVLAQLSFRLGASWFFSAHMPFLLALCLARLLARLAIRAVVTPFNLGHRFIRRLPCPFFHRFLPVPAAPYGGISHAYKSENERWFHRLELSFLLGVSTG